jgi:hypothetical protein
MLTTQEAWVDSLIYPVVQVNQHGAAGTLQSGTSDLQLADGELHPMARVKVVEPVQGSQALVVVLVVSGHYRHLPAQSGNLPDR